jgi:hypothetical protein
MAFELRTKIACGRDHIHDFIETREVEGFDQKLVIPSVHQPRCAPIKLGRAVALTPYARVSLLKRRRLHFFIAVEMHSG